MARPIVIVGKVELKRVAGRRCPTMWDSIHLLSKNGAPDGLDEVRGEFWDVGRMKPEDPRLNGYDLKTTFKFDSDCGLAAARGK